MGSEDRCDEAKKSVREAIVRPSQRLLDCSLPVTPLGQMRNFDSRMNEAGVEYVTSTGTSDGISHSHVKKNSRSLESGTSLGGLIHNG